MKVIELLNKLSTARMEYQSSNQSVLNNFVVPYFIDNCDLRASSHSIALVGSRGSGKSTYIRHFSHSTRFDPRRTAVEESEFDCIVLYWKPDTAYCQGLMTEWLGDHAIQFFMIHAALSLLDEICSMLNNVASHFPDVLQDLTKNGSFYLALSNVTKATIGNMESFKKWIREKRYEISTRLNPVNTEELMSIEPNSMLTYIIDCLRDDCSMFRETIFKIFVDEFELLTAYQQKIINTYRKESKKIINWNVAYKSNSSPSTETTSDQWLQKPDDYREHDIDEYIRSDYTIYAAEIFILTLQNAGLQCNEIKLTPDFLGNRENLILRKDVKYKAMVSRIVNKILPTPSIRELSQICLGTDLVTNKIKALCKELSLEKESVASILADPSLAMTFLGASRQKTFNAELFLKYLAGDKSVTNKINDKIHSYELNSILSLNLQNSALEAPVYAGFERYITMTIPNVRHFKELSYSAIKAFYETTEPSDVDSIEDIPSIPYQCMHDAAILTSSSLVKEVVSYPPHGNKLSQMVNRMGELFKISQKSTYQTEPERVIFSIEYDFAGDDIELEDFIRSAKCWRVLIVDDSRRIKSDLQETSQEFQLNPIYSPKFGISIRKKRGILLSVDQFKCIINGNNSQYLAMRKFYQKKWKVDDIELKQGLLL